MEIRSFSAYLIKQVQFQINILEDDLTKYWFFEDGLICDRSWFYIADFRINIVILEAGLGDRANLLNFY